MTRTPTGTARSVGGGGGGEIYLYQPQEGEVKDPLLEAAVAEKVEHDRAALTAEIFDEFEDVMKAAQRRELQYTPSDSRSVVDLHDQLLDLKRRLYARQEEQVHSTSSKAYDYLLTCGHYLDRMVETARADVEAKTVSE